jgi:hypothetical protein
VGLSFVTRAFVTSVEDLDGKTSEDENVEKVRQFCAKCSLPYSVMFRCVFIYREGEGLTPHHR